jgi:hypothetical protein
MQSNAKHLLTFAISIFAALPAHASIIFFSGNGVVGGTDSSITFLSNGTTDDFPGAFTPAQFTAAQSGTPADIIGFNGAWIPALPDGPGAQWISTNPFGVSGSPAPPTGLFAIPFNVSVDLASVTLTLFYAVDNQLGQTNPGLYLDGVALPASTGIGGFSSENIYTDIIGSLSAGTHFFYMDVVNVTNGGANPGGVIFYANVDGTTAPEPGSALLVALGLTAAITCRKQFMTRR